MVNVVYDLNTKFSHCIQQRLITSVLVGKVFLQCCFQISMSNKIVNNVEYMTFCFVNCGLYHEIWMILMFWGFW